MPASFQHIDGSVRLALAREACMEIAELSGV